MTGKNGVDLFLPLRLFAIINLLIVSPRCLRQFHTQICLRDSIFISEDIILFRE